MALVLCTGVDFALVRTRQLILQRAGHTVVIAMNESAVVSACEQHEFDVAVIGQTVSSQTKRQLGSLVRQHCPTAKVLELYRFSLGKVLEDADEWLEVPVDVPQELAERVSALAGD